jgi:predicted transglutaminase-like cysteine proteinase
MAKIAKFLAATLVVSVYGPASANMPGDANTDGSGGLGTALSIGFGRSAPIPMGYYQLCKANSSVCVPRSGKDERIAGGAVVLSPALAKELVSVNAEVNRSIRPVTDMQQFRVADRWTVSPRNKRGDCEDYALTKKARLLGKGWPSSALLIALANTWRGEEHAVLIVRTDHGDFVLDNLTSAVRGWTPTLYRWKTVQSPANEWVWNKIEQGAKVQFASRQAPEVAPQSSPTSPSEESAHPAQGANVRIAHSLLWVKEMAAAIQQGPVAANSAVDAGVSSAPAVAVDGVRNPTPGRSRPSVWGENRSMAAAAPFAWPSMPPALLMAMSTDAPVEMPLSLQLTNSSSSSRWLINWKSGSQYPRPEVLFQR